MSEPRKNRAFGVISGSASNYARQIVDVLVFMFLTPFTAHMLGKDAFGLWSLMWSTVGLFALFDFGYSSAVVKFVADARGRSDPGRLGRVTATFFWVHIALGALLLLAAAGCAPLIPHLFRIPAGLGRAASLVFFLLAFRAAYGMPMSMFASILVGFQRQVFVNLLKILSTLVYASVTYAVFTWRPSVEALAWINLLTFVVTSAATMLISTRINPGVRVAPQCFDRRLLREISSFSVYSFVIQISSLLYTRVDAIVIQEFLDLSKVAYYSVAMSTVSKAGLLCSQFSAAWTPLLAELKGAGDDEAIRTVLRKASKLTTALATPLLIGLFWFSRPLIEVWMKPEYAPAVIPLRCLLLAAFSGIVHSVPNNVLSMTGHQRFTSLASVAGQVLNLVLTLVMVVPLGINGVALATLLASTLIEAGVICPRACRTYHLSVFTFYRTTLLPSLAPCALMLGALWALQLVLPPTALWRIAVLELAACAVFAAGFYTMGLSAKERTYYFERLAAMLRRRTTTAPPERR